MATPDLAAGDCKHLLKCLGRSRNGATVVFSCRRCPLVIGINWMTVKSLVRGEAKKLRIARNVFDYTGQVAAGRAMV